MDREQLKAELRAEIEAEQKAKGLTVKFGNKQNVVVGGPALGQRFPVTLYAPSWLVLLDHAEEIRAFIETHKDELVWEK
jgi:hypothetical protein